MSAEPSDLPDGLIIPVDLPSIEDFKQQFEAAVSDDGCHFYFDTSILVWLTQIGKAARAQLKDWIHTVGERRFHVPVWAAHEFFNHHVNDLIGRKLSDVADAMRKTADETYSEIRPFLGEPVDERSPEELHLQVRDTLVQLKRLASDVGRWKEKHYQQHVQEVVDLITSLRLRHRPGIIEFMADIDVLERNRYSGRVPPGFKDKQKRPKKLESAKSDAAGDLFGSNRYGDLMFWREVLEHASADAAITGLVIISNDTLVSPAERRRLILETIKRHQTKTTSLTPEMTSEYAGTLLALASTGSESVVRRANVRDRPDSNIETDSIPVLRSQ